jgi:hypothetical protein
MRRLRISAEEKAARRGAAARRRNLEVAGPGHLGLVRHGCRTPAPTSAPAARPQSVTQSQGTLSAGEGSGRWAERGGGGGEGR